MAFARAGFVYTGSNESDRTTCLACGSKFYSWKRGENPLGEHEQEDSLTPACIKLIRQNHNPFRETDAEVRSGTTYRIKMQSESDSIASICEDKHYYPASLVIPENVEIRIIKKDDIDTFIDLSQTVPTQERSANSVAVDMRSNCERKAHINK